MTGIWIRKEKKKSLRMLWVRNPCTGKKTSGMKNFKRSMDGNGVTNPGFMEITNVIY